MGGLFSYFSNAFNLPGFFHYFRVYPELIRALFENYNFVVLIFFGLAFLGSTLINGGTLWILALFRPKSVYRPISARLLKRNPLVSFVIAGLNEELTIARTLSSLLNCGYANLEIIFVNDGSSDNTVREAERIARMVRASPAGHLKKIRVFSAPRRGGKPAALNIGIKHARGEFIGITDADSEVQFGSIQHWLKPFEDPKVGAVAANIRCANGTASLLTRLQEIQFSVRITVRRFFLSKINLVPLVAGAGGLFRATAIRAIGCYDNGLGDDIDLTLRLLKSGWKIDFVPDAVVWTAMPQTLAKLRRQRTRWARNGVMIWMNKQRDMLPFSGFKYGPYLFIRGWLYFQNIVGPAVRWPMIIAVLLTGPFDRPFLISTIYVVGMIWTAISITIARDIARAPPPRAYLVVPIYPFYAIGISLVTLFSTLGEFLRLFPRHPYTPEHIWREAPRW